MKSQERLNRRDINNKERDLSMVSKQKSHFDENMKKYSPDEALNGLLSTTRVNFERKNEYAGYLQNHYGNRGTQLLIQAKLNISQPDDKYEREAEEIADKVMKMPSPEKSGLNKTPPPVIQSKYNTDSNTFGNVEVDTETESKIKGLLGNGSPLPLDVKQDMEGRFVADFSEVRVHSDTESIELNERLNSNAFTLGKDIFLSENIFNLKGNNSSKLLAHELVHFQQQNNQQNSIFRQGEKDRIKKLEELVAQQGETIEEQSLEIKKGKIKDVLQDLYDDANSMRVDWENCARDIGNAYYNAYKNHENALKKRTKQKALRADIVWGILTTVTGGALGWIGEVKDLSKGFHKFIQKEELRIALKGSLEDAAQTFIGESIDVIQAHKAPSFEIRKDPVNFRHDFFNMVYKNWKECNDYIQEKKDEIDKWSREKFKNINEDQFKKEVEGWLNNKKNMGNPNSPGQTRLQKEYETNMWAQWAPSCKEIITTMTVSVHMHQVRQSQWPSYDSPGSDVENALENLQPIRDFPTDIDWGWFWTSDEDIIKFINWGIQYKPFEFQF